MKKIVMALVMAAATTAMALDMPQELKGKVIKVVSPVTPGGLIDTRIRPIMSVIEKQTGLEMVMINMQGNNQGIGTTHVANSKPDGLTIGFTTSPTSIVYDLVKGIGHPSREDFVPFVAVYEYSQAISVPYNAPFNTLKEAIAYVNANKGKLNYAFMNAESALAFEEVFKSAVVGVPVKNWGEVAILMKQGDMSFMLTNVGTAVEQEKNKQTKIIAVTSAKRHPTLPNIPAVSEVFPGFGMKTVVAMYAPKNTPQHILDYLNEAFVNANKSTEIQEMYTRYDHQPYYLNVEQSRVVIDKEYNHFSRLLKSTGVKIK